jgi:hypothetical protein
MLLTSSSEDSSLNHSPTNTSSINTNHTLFTQSVDNIYQNTNNQVYTQYGDQNYFSNPRTQYYQKLKIYLLNFIF